MHSTCDPARDIPSPAKKKIAVFHPQGLRIYGLIPYILGKKLKSKFVGTDIRFADNIDNFTIVPYQQKPANAQALVDWLMADAGCEWFVSNDKLTESLWHEPATEQLASVLELLKNVFGCQIYAPGDQRPMPWDVVLGVGVQSPLKTDVVLGGEVSGNS